MDLHRYSIYAYILMTGFLVFVLYYYIIYLYRSEKKGEKDFEKYGSLALNDELDDKLLEENDKSRENKGVD